MITLFRRKSLRAAADEAYLRVLAQSRRPEFFRDCGVPDTVDGRFDVICLHAFLFMHRIKNEPPPAAEFGQCFFDTMFVDFDRSLREMGTGDLGVGRQVKRMAQGLYGRIRAYETGLRGDDAELHAALARNLFGTAAASEVSLGALSRYLRREEQQLSRLASGEMLAGRVIFGPAPMPAGESEVNEHAAADKLIVI